MSWPFVALQLQKWCCLGRQQTSVALARVAASLMSSTLLSLLCLFCARELVLTVERPLLGLVPMEGWTVVVVLRLLRRLLWRPVA